MGGITSWFTLPGTNAAKDARNAQSNIAGQQADYTKNWMELLKPYQKTLTSSLDSTTNALNSPLSQIKLQQYTHPNYAMPTTPTNPYAGLNTAAFNVDNLPDVYKPSAETLAGISGNIDPNAQQKAVTDSYAMNDNKVLAERANSINTAAQQRGLGGRQGGMSTLDTSALSGLANQRQRMAAEGNLAGITAGNNAQQLRSGMLNTSANLSRNSALDAFNQAQYQNTLRQQDFGNQMDLAGANQSFGQQDYQNKLTSIGQLRDWTMGDINQANDTAIKEGTYNTNQQQTSNNNQLQLAQLLMSILNPSAMTGGLSSAANGFQNVEQSANNQMASSGQWLSQLASLFPNALKF